MKNLEQIRAANAWAYARAGVNTKGSQGGEVVKKLPALIMSNGLLAAAAFAYAKGHGEGWYDPRSGNPEPGAAPNGGHTMGQGTSGPWRGRHR